jgi:hypothetical protein
MKIAEITKVLADPMVRANLQQTAQEPVGESTQLMRKDFEKYRRLVVELKIKAQ